MKIATKLLRWYKKHGRELPWRNTTDSYQILVSEIMLQQTQVSRVIEFYEQWLERFPNWSSLAEASNADVIRAWAGLGYNRRALMLRDIARAVVKNGVPESEEEWKRLKGIGPYTAAALAVFSLRQKSVPVDTNIRRVIGRIFLEKHYPDLKDDDEVRRAGDRELMSSKEFYEIPQALFDLATMHCTKIPDCSSCPLRNECRSSDAFLSGEVNTPKRMIKKSKERIHRNKKYPDRIYRGRILKAARSSERVHAKEIGRHIDEHFDEALDGAWLTAMLNRLKQEKMVRIKNGFLELYSG